MIAYLAFAFVAGTVATANPCGFALLPAYLARQVGDGRAGGSAASAVVRALGVGAITTAGFLVVFGAVGTALTLGARSLTRVIPWAALAIGVALFAAGIAVLAGRRVAVRLPALQRPREQRGFASVLVFGIGYGVASLSCTLPVFLAVLGPALTRTAAGGLVVFAAYAAGMGTMLTALAVAAALSRAGLATATRRLLPHIHRISGALLAAAGAYVIFYWSAALFPHLMPGRAAAAVLRADQLSAGVQTWLQTPAGQAATAATAATLAGLIIWALWRARHRPPTRAAKTHSSDESSATHTPPGLPQRPRTSLRVTDRPHEDEHAARGE